MQPTNESIAALTLAGGKADHIVFDEDLPGFGIRLRAGGKRVWLVQYRADGRQRRETLGDVRKVSLKDARAAARKRFAAVTLGGDPQADKQEAGAGGTDLRPVSRPLPRAERKGCSAKHSGRRSTLFEDHFRPLRGLQSTQSPGGLSACGLARLRLRTAPRQEHGLASRSALFLLG